MHARKFISGVLQKIEKSFSGIFGAFCALGGAKQTISPSRLRCDRVAIVATIANLVCCRRRSQTLFAIELFGTPNRKPRLSAICDRLRLLRDYKGNLEERAEHWYPSAAKTTHETATGFGRSNCQMNCCRTQICPRNAIATLSAISPLPFHHGVAV